MLTNENQKQLSGCLKQKFTELVTAKSATMNNPLIEVERKLRDFLRYSFVIDTTVSVSPFYILDNEKGITRDEECSHTVTTDANQVVVKLRQYPNIVPLPARKSALEILG